MQNLAVQLGYCRRCDYLPTPERLSSARKLNASTEEISLCVETHKQRENEWPVALIAEAFMTDS